MIVLRADQYATVPWRNGGGTTREIAAYRDPSRHDDFLWRLSIATVAKPGPFSLFVGVDRTIALVEGAGMTLHSPTQTTLIGPDTPAFSFPGETEIYCELTEGTTIDLNIMTRRGFFAHNLRRECSIGWHAIEGFADQTLVVSNGRLELSTIGRASLGPLDTVAAIGRGSICELYSDRPSEVFVVELTAL